MKKKKPQVKRRKYKRQYGKGKRTGEFASKLEQRMWNDLTKLVDKSAVKYESARLKYLLEKVYVPDFVVSHPSLPSPIYLEIKGYFRPQDRAKALAVKKVNPDADIRFVFDKDNKLSRHTKTTYSQWCQKHGFLYSIGSIPKFWFPLELHNKKKKKRADPPTNVPVPTLAEF